MRVLLVALTLLAVSSAAEAATRGTAEEMQACKVRQVELARAAEGYQGEPLTKRLIEADLRRASREETEGDGDECLEALDHAAKLLAGET